MWLCMSRFPPLGLHKGFLNSLCLLILLIHIKHKSNKMKFCTEPMLSFAVILKSKRQGINTITFCLPLPLWFWYYRCWLDRINRDVIKTVLISFKENPSTGWIRLKAVTNNWAVAHKSWMVRCSPRTPGILVEAICPTIRPEFRFSTDLFLLFAHAHSTKMYVALWFNLSFVYDHLTKN